MTTELRELVCVPNAGSASRMVTSRPASASSRAMARPTAPAPMTAQSIGCMDIPRPMLAGAYGQVQAQAASARQFENVRTGVHVLQRHAVRFDQTDLVVANPAGPMQGQDWHHLGPVFPSATAHFH